MQEGVKATFNQSAVLDITSDGATWEERNGLDGAKYVLFVRVRRRTTRYKPKKLGDAFEEGTVIVGTAVMPWREKNDREGQSLLGGNYKIFEF